MHFVTGGAFNGKKKWVTAFYKLEQTPHQWHSFYKEKEAPELREEIVVLEGVERYIRALLERSGTPEEARLLFRKQLEKWQKEDRTVILIGTDITKGIVPMNAFDRFFRDAAGWCFQDTAAASRRVDTVWYGIAETIKEETE
ncbi:bifunctional adenosylcobinamide kinase/adenosylcobinamide-phosphate guanylyltransferase [Domibacillus sp. PGB-M46]|uniref:bifunctional adenosylcobinamide kinase/adenosylcobinamide-phosphate guanylyltransferase n=1 Tax=Domibacillus sp. PGB-M46 TaxID=2910255 RepID=UPI001F57BFB4|nr:bifunctional adenosylcobinamide kinase/adenosylcobinamide-phosphate guanylyltransferase [Domibacillus sp. PGB-M46]MCI2254926.1 bifunctional adenosylcobinamide kinase/adenosylcobinamide-phosphate guanylyltransferase [Domibacillus sp. PGB-M46]